MAKLIGLFGGTFDPIHLGHLAVATAVTAQLACSKFYFLPSQPAYRAAPLTTATQRLDMLQLAIADHPEWQVDTRELFQPTPAYTVDTLTAIRHELGNTPLAFIFSMDQCEQLATWHEFQRLPLLAHLIIVNRSNYMFPTQGPVTELLTPRFIQQPQQLLTASAGYVLLLNMPPLSIAATQLRELIRNSGDASPYLPTAVWKYIQTQRLYRSQ